MAWQYQREEQRFPIVPEGPCRIRIKSAEKAISKKGNDMLTLQFTVSGSGLTLFHYITFMDDRPEITNRMLTQFFDSFKDIPDGDFNTNNWVGKVGACVVKHEDYNGSPSAKISYFLKPDKAESLPAWKEPSGADGGSGDKDHGFAPLADDVPFD